MERLAARQLLSHLQASGMLPRLQSAYRANHSTETAVFKVLSDILLAIDSSDLSALVLLDLSAAFDTVDHPVLLRRLETSFGLKGKVLQWLRTYLVGRRQYVRRGSSTSSPAVSTLLRCTTGVRPGLDIISTVHRRPVFSDRQSWSSLPSLCGRYADLRLLSSARDTGTHGDYVSVHR